PRGGDGRPRLPHDNHSRTSEHGGVRRQSERRDLLLRRRQCPEGRQRRHSSCSAAKQRWRAENAAQAHPRKERAAGEVGSVARGLALWNWTGRARVFVEQGWWGVWGVVAGNGGGGAAEVRIETGEEMRLLDGLTQDFKLALRSLSRQRAWTTVAVATLALGIGVNSAAFTIINAVLLRPLPYPDSKRIVSISESDKGV